MNPTVDPAAARKRRLLGELQKRGTETKLIDLAAYLAMVLVAAVALGEVRGSFEEKPEVLTSAAMSPGWRAMEPATSQALLLGANSSSGVQ